MRFVTGFIYLETKGGIVSQERIFSKCPMCRREVIINSNITKKNDIGFQINNVKTCDCGYSSSVIIQQQKLDKYIAKTNPQIKRICLDCNSIWNFNYTDIVKEKYNKGKNNIKAVYGLAGSPIGLMPDTPVQEHDRCHVCGSRNVVMTLYSYGNILDSYYNKREKEKQKQIEAQRQKEEQHEKSIESGCWWNIKNEENKEKAEARQRAIPKKKKKGWF